MESELRLEIIYANHPTAKQLTAIHALCNRAYEEDLTPIFKTFTDATHAEQDARYSRRTCRKDITNLRKRWEWSTKEERRDLVRMMIQEVGVDLAAKSIRWVKARPDYELQFSILDGLHQDSKRRHWIERREA